MAEQLGLQQVEVEDDSGRTLTGVGVAEESLQEVIDAREADVSDAAASDGSEAPPSPRAPADSPTEPRRTDARDPQTGQFTKPTRGQKRFDQLTREAREAQRERDAEKERYAALEREFNELKTRQAAPSTPPAAPPTQAVKAADQVAATQARAGIQPTRPRPIEDDIGTKYAQYTDFVEDTAQWVMEQGANNPQSAIRAAIRNELQGWQQEQTITARKRELATNWDGAQTRGRQKYQDFDQRVSPLLSVELEGPILDTLAAHPQAEEIVYRLMSDPALVQAFAGPQADPIQRAMILGQLVAMTPAAAAPASATRVASSTAPPPYQPVRASAKTTVPSPEEIAGAGGGDLSNSYDSYRAAKRRSS